MRRAVIAVPSNIAEGQGRGATRAYMNHISIAYGSLMELETQIHLCVKLNYIKRGMAVLLLDRSSEIAKMLSGLKNSLSRICNKQ